MEIVIAWVLTVIGIGDIAAWWITIAIMIGIVLALANWQ